MQSLYNSFDEHDACGVGFVGRLDNQADHKIIEHTLTAMAHLIHRGGQEDDEKMSDGSGILIPIPRNFFGKSFPEMLNPSLSWGLGSFFLPHDTFMQEGLMDIIERVAEKFSFKIVGNREVPTDINVLSRKILATLPEFRHILFVSQKDFNSDEEKEKALYVLRKQIESEAIVFLEKHSRDLSIFHVASLSSHSIIYKGILPGKNLGKFYLDLSEEDFAVTFAIFHERFSTNTKPSWHLAQPFRHVAHNGEINTIRGNKMQMHIRETGLKSEVYGEDLHYVLPSIHPSTSDSGAFDNVFEFLLRGGYSLEHAITTMIPDPIINTNDKKKSAFYTYNQPLMEPWDGPTTMVFTDGHSKIGACLDRNGLRPCRYSVTKDNIVVLASEIGVLDLPEEEYIKHGQLSPRTIFMVDFEKGEFIKDEKIKKELFSKVDYTKILSGKRVRLKNHDMALSNEVNEGKEEMSYLFGYTDKSPQSTLISMIKAQEEPVGAMGLDEPLAMLSSKPQLLFNYFKQLFAQVTNPSIDPIREKLSMSLATTLGGKANIFQDPKEFTPYFYLDSPFLFGSDIAEIRANKAIESKRLSITMPLNAGFSAFLTTLEGLCLSAEKAVKDGKRVLILSDKDMSSKTVPLPILLAVGAVHQDLIRKDLRHSCDIILETGQAYEVMHMALLFSFGANAIYPFAAYSSLQNYINNNKKLTAEFDYETALKSYFNALEKGLLKVLGRLGISTLSSFTGAQCFEAIGLHSDVIEKYFTGTYSRIGGIHLEDIYAENQARFLSCLSDTHELSQSDKHIWSRENCSFLRTAVVDNEFPLFQKYTDALNKQAQCITLRSVWKYKASKALDLSSVESVQSIRTRFFGAAMSLGALSKESHECIALGYNNLALLSNCGEGGEERKRTLSRGTTEDLCSRIRQIASGRFGVTAEYLASGDEVQIKVAQGAKPGEGGQLPAQKVTPYIAEVRHTQPNVSLISPPPHHDIYSIEDLAQLIYDIKKLREGLKVSVKLVAEAGIGTVAVGVVKAGADTICISGHDGGTGAAPLSSIYHVGLPWELGIAEVHQALLANAMRYKVRLQTDGQIHTGKDVITAFMLGADEVVFGTSLLIAMGCVLCRQCYKGRCPVGICTQDDDLRARFKGKAEHIENLINFIAEDTRNYLSQLGFTSIDEIIGRADLLEIDYALLPEKAKDINMSALFKNLSYTKRKKEQIKGIEKAIWEEDALALATNAVAKNIPLKIEQKIKNTERAIATDIAGMMALSGKTFEEDFIQIHCKGTAGQSFGALTPKGITLFLEGSANDYVGKSLCGGKICISPYQGRARELEKQSRIGNVTLYGATSGKLFVCGAAGERFAVRNSGALAVVEGLGEHGCEYMTGGTVVVLGSCGYNFAAGMTGGSVYVHDPKKELHLTCNCSSVDIDSLEDKNENELKAILEEHLLYTHSFYAQSLLENWERSCTEFVKVVPHEAKKVLENK